MLILISDDVSVDADAVVAVEVGNVAGDVQLHLVTGAVVLLPGGSVRDVHERLRAAQDEADAAFASPAPPIFDSRSPFPR